MSNHRCTIAAFTPQNPGAVLVQNVLTSALAQSAPNSETEILLQITELDILMSIMALDLQDPVMTLVTNNPNAALSC